jgi:beta-galactosidase
MGEEDHPAILDWSGRPGDHYRVVQAIFREFAALEPHLKNATPQECPAAILFHFDSAYYDILKRSSTDLRQGTYREHLVQAHAMLSRLGIPCDILPAHPGIDLGRYRLVILPQLEMVEPWLAEQLRRYVAGGGVLLGQPRLSVLDANGKYRTDPMPAGLTDLFGVDVQDRCVPSLRYGSSDAFHPEPNTARVAIPVELACGGSPMTSTAHDFMELVSPQPDARILGWYRAGAYADTPLLVERRFEGGCAAYQAAWLEEEGSRQLLLWLAERAGLRADMSKPVSVDILKRGRLRFYLNHSDAPATVPLREPGTVLVGTAREGAVSLSAFDVCVIQEGE